MYYEDTSAAAPFTVVCIRPDGSVARFERGRIEAAYETLDEMNRSGRYVSGSIWTDADEEIDGFAAPARRNFSESPCDNLRD